MTHRLRLLLGTALLMSAAVCYAEKADRNQEVVITFARTDFIAKDNSSVTISGDVILEQGTLKITAERMVIKKDQKDNVTAEIFGTSDKQITFRAKRDNAAEYMEGIAGRAEFDQKKGIVKLLDRAQVKSGGLNMTGDIITYNQNTEQYEIDTPVGKPGATSGARSKIVIPPPKPDTDSEKK